MKKQIMAMGLLALVLSSDAAVITDVAARQRYPWNGLVDVIVSIQGDTNEIAQTECTFAATNCATRADVKVETICQMGADVFATDTCTRRYLWNASNDVGEVKIDDLALTVQVHKKLGGVQLWEDGPYWAECNVGATKPEEYGYYFWWGDTVGYERNADNDGWVSVKDGTTFEFSDSNCLTWEKSTAQLQSLGYIDSAGNLVAAHDAATAHRGTPWRMPTVYDSTALVNKCTTILTTTNGVCGLLVIGKGRYAARSIFLPGTGYGGISYRIGSGSCGYYWSSTPYSDNSKCAWSLFFNANNFYRSSSGRDYGHTVRPLRGFVQGVSVGMGLTHLALDTRTETRYARAEEPIVFSTDWREGVTRLVLNVDGANVLTATSATNGVYVWTPDFSVAKTVTLKHTTRAPSSNEVLSATFTVEAFDVTFSPGAHGSFAAGAVTSQRVPHGADAVPPEVTPDAGYTFSGWSASPSNITADASCVACYAAIAYPITYTNLYGATHANPDTYTIEDAVTFVAPQSIPRRQFVRWEPSALAVGTTGPVTVRAVWETTPYVYADAENGDDANDGSTAERAVKTLARAFALAEDGDIIHVAAGTYAPVTASGKAVTFRAADGARIDGGGTVRCVTADEDVVFENFTLANGYDGEAGGGAMGGTFDGCTITNCVSDWDGGGAYESILRNCVIVGNTAENGWGGGTYGCALENCRVLDNISGDEGGGAYAPARVSGTMFRGNSPDAAAGEDATVTAGSAYVHTPEGGAIAYSVSYDWLVAQGFATYGASTADLAAKLSATQANGYTGWESYVAGLAPTNPASQFTATVTISNGLVSVGWSPNLNTATDTRIYTLYSRADLGAGDWVTPIQAWHRFFNVAVAMPTGDDGEETAVADEGFVPTEDPATLGGVQLWANGPYWAECNVGASNPEEYGYYFWWGDTVGYQYDANYGGWGSVKDHTVFTFESGNCPTVGKDNAMLQSLGYIDSTGNLVAAHDAATAHLGAPWRMPTDAEMSALISNCTTTWITTNGVSGRLVMGKGDYASKSIFLPAAGYGYRSGRNYPGLSGSYWSSTLDLANSNGAMNLYFGSGDHGQGSGYRSNGLTIRPLREFAE